MLAELPDCVQVCAGGLEVARVPRSVIVEFDASKRDLSVVVVDQGVAEDRDFAAACGRRLQVRHIGSV